MKKQQKFKIIRDSLYDETFCLVSPDGTSFEFKQNIVDEDGNYLSWYFHPVFKKLNYVYWDGSAQRFWLPKADLINKTKLKSLLKKRKDDLAFFNYGYAEALLNDKPTKNKRDLSGLLK